LPEYRRVLGAQSGDVHDPGEIVHTQLRVTARRARDRPRPPRCRRAATPRRRSGTDGLKHVALRVWIATTCRTVARGGLAACMAEIAAACADIGRGPDPDFKGNPIALRLSSTRPTPTSLITISKRIAAVPLARPGGRLRAPRWAPGPRQGH